MQMNQYVHIKSEPVWHDEQLPDNGEEQASLLRINENGPTVDVPVCSQTIRGIADISQSSYSAAVNLAHGAAGIKQERQVAVVPTEVDFDRIIPQFVCAPGATSSPPCEMGRFVFCAVAGSPIGENVKAEPVDETVGDKHSQGDELRQRANLEHACEKCGVKLRSRLALKQHSRIHSDKHVEMNSNEDKTAVIASEAKPGTTCGDQTVLSIPKGKTHFCEDQTTLSTSAMKLHACDICKATFPRRSQLENHRKYHAKPHVCEVCDARFSHLSSLTEHSRTHSGDHPFTCDLCEARFTKRSAVASHARTHTGDRPYACDECDGRFTQAGVLARHVSGVHGRGKNKVVKYPRDRVREYPCTECDRRFACARNLVYHMRRHAPRVLTETCPDCGKRFATQSDLVRHRRQHDPVKPFACQFCPARFAAKGSLGRHSVIHTRPTPFRCGVCDDSFASRFMLDRHRAIHSDGHLPLDSHSHSHEK